MTEFPLVTVNILSFNRKDELRNTLTKVYEQDYKNIEVIVVDNASSDGSPEMVKEEFPNVKLIQLDENIGIAGWNKGFEIAKGEYVLVLDDDAYPAENSLDLAVKKIESDIYVACIAFNIVDLNKQNKMRTHWLPEKGVTQTEWPVFVGCIALFRKNYLKPNPMPENYFLYQHELPVSADIYLRGYKIFYSINIIGYHFFKSIRQKNKILEYYSFMNNLKFISYYFPNIIGVIYILKNAIFYMPRAIRHNWIREYIAVIFKIRFNFSQKKLPFSYFLNIRRLSIINDSILSKFRVDKWEK